MYVCILCASDSHLCDEKPKPALMYTASLIYTKSFFTLLDIVVYSLWLRQFAKMTSFVAFHSWLGGVTVNDSALGTTNLKSVPCGTQILLNLFR